MSNLNCSSDNNSLLNAHSSKSIMSILSTMSQAPRPSQSNTSNTFQQSNSSSSTPSPTINPTIAPLSQQQQFESYPTFFQLPFYELDKNDSLNLNEESTIKALTALQTHGPSSTTSFLTPCLLFDKNNAQLINNHSYSLQQTNSNSSSSSDLSQSTNNCNLNSELNDVFNQSLLLFKQKLPTNQVGLPNQTSNINIIQQANTSFHAITPQLHHPNQHNTQMITLNKKKLLENDLILKHARELRRAQLHFKPY